MDERNYYRKYLEKQAEKKIEFLLNHYEQSYKACIIKRQSGKFKSIASGGYLIVFLLIFMSLEILLYILRCLIIPSSMSELPLEILDILMVWVGVFFGIFVLAIGVYIFKQIYYNKKSQMYMDKNGCINDECYYLALINRYKYLYNNIDECSENELIEIIEIDCTEL